MKTHSLLLLTMFVFAGCTTGKHNGGDILEENPKNINLDVPLNEDLVIQNLVFALTQISDTHPLKTTVSLKPSRSSLGSIIEGRFNDAGYGIQYVQADEGEHYVNHTALKNTSGGGVSTTYKIHVGPISIEREYRSFSGTTQPSSIVKVTGVEEQDITLNDEIFGNEYTDTQFREVHFLNDVIEEASITDITRIQLESDEFKEDENTFSSLVKKNMRSIMRSNYASLFDEYDVVQQTVLEFPNDSMKIGSKNKKTVRFYVSEFNPETDIMSVIGCSHGKTKIGDGGQSGNQLLALGRANRVKEALIFSGLDQTEIFEEGCWDNEYFDTHMPRRGVILTHKRLTGQG